MSSISQDSDKNKINKNKTSNINSNLPQKNSLDKEKEEDIFTDTMKLKILQKQRQKVGGSINTSSSLVKNDHSEDVEENLDDMVEQNEASSRESKIKERSSEFSKLKEDLLRSRRAVQVITGADAEALRQEAAFKSLITPLEQRRQKYIKRKQEHGDRSSETMDKLKKFTSDLRSKKTSLDNDVGQDSNQISEVYHGQILELDEKGDEDLSDWNSGKLKFKKHIDDQFRNA